MSKLIANEKAFEFTDDELKSIHILPENLLQKFSTDLYFEKEKLRNIQPDPNNYTAYVQEHATHAGVIAYITHWIDAHKELVQSLAVDNSLSQQ